MVRLAVAAMLALAMLSGAAWAGDTSLAWDEGRIEASRQLETMAPLPDGLDPDGFIALADAVRGRVSVVDGKAPALLGQIDVPLPILGRPQTGADGRFLFLLSADGWVRKFDLAIQRLIGRVRAGEDSRAIAISGDGKWLAVANDAPNTLVILATADLSVADILTMTGKDGTATGIAGLVTNPVRESFILTLADVPEVREVFYGANPPFYGFVHDFRIEGPPDYATPFPMRRMVVPDRLADLSLDPTGEYAVAATANANGLAVVDLVTGHGIAGLTLPDRPLPGSGTVWRVGDRSLIAVPHDKSPTIVVADMKTLEVAGRIETGMAGSSVSGRPDDPHLWIPVRDPSDGTAIGVVDRRSLQTVTTLKLEDGQPGKPAFSRNGGLAFVPVASETGAIIVYDTATRRQIVRLPSR